MKMLVTGATGFVGSWLTKKLLDLGHDVRILSRSGRADFPFDSSKIEVIRGEISDIESLNRATQNIHSVFHLAGVVGYSRAMRQQMYETNVVGTKNIINSCQKSSCKRLVHMSSVVAVGASFDGKRPLNEDSPFNLHHLDLGYFETKLEAENLVREAVKSGRLDVVILNPSTIYGPGDAKKGSRSTQIKVARGNFPFYTSGGVSVIHIEDLVSAVYRAWEVGRTGERYILSGENITIQQLFEIIAKEAGVNAPKVYLPNSIVLSIGKIGDILEKFNKRGPINTENGWASILYHWFDNSKAQRELNFKPRPAQAAISDSVRWMKENKVI
jgi:dihydroflavonol-4-reductase